MITLGITGGVGSGKTEVLHYICDKYNVKLIFCDELAKNLLKKDVKLKFNINQEFTNYNILDTSGNIDSKKLANIVFNDKDSLKRLNSIIHPAVKEEVLSEINNPQYKSMYDAVIVEAALLLEENYDSLFDCIYIFCNKDERIKRLKETRGYKEEYSQSVMNNQLSEEVFKTRCKYTVDNSKDLKDTFRQIDDILVNKYHLRRKDV